jgi:hypothetical protein
MSEAEEKKCRNCKELISPNSHYCWNCGQKTKDLKLNFWHFISEFFSTIFNIDNKFFQTVIKLFIPAQLTIDFFNGIRKKYYHPFRIYFVCILLLFFVISRVQPKSVHSENDSESEVQEFTEIPQVESNDTLNGLNNRFLKKNREKKYGKRLIGYEGLETSVLSKQKQYLFKEYDAFRTNIESDTSKDLIDSFFNRLYFVQEGDTMPVWDTSDLMPIEIKLLNEYVLLSIDDRFSTNIDTVVAQKNLSHWTDRVFLKRQLVLTRGDFNKALYTNLTWLLLAIVPIQALILRLLYFRRKKFYIEHYVFLLELYSAIMLATAASLLFLPLCEDWDMPLNFAFVVSSIFALFSFKRFYRKSWLATVFKFLFVGLLFFISTFLAVIGFFVIVALFF